MVKHIIRLLKRKKIKILVLVGGNKSKIEPFLSAGNELGLDVVTASFSDVVFDSFNKEANIRVQDVDLTSFSHIYIRMVGKRLEDATLVANYAKKHGIKVFDPIYQDSLLMPSSLGKSVEMIKLINHDAHLPRTIYGSVDHLSRVAAKQFGYPFVVKSTTGKKAREVWSPENKKQAKELFAKLASLEKEGSRFFAQEFLYASERIRVFVIGNQAVAAIIRPTKWRKRLGKEGRKQVLNPIPEKVAKVAVKAAWACGLCVSGVDVVRDEKTDKLYVLEANAAPVWDALSHDTGIKVEEEILRYISTK